MYNGMISLRPRPVYKSTRLGGQASPGYIWQSTIRISTTTKYTLIQGITVSSRLVIEPCNGRIGGSSKGHT